MRRLPAGQLNLLAGLTDAGAASLGTFLAGVVAVRELPAAGLALYVVLASATVFTMPLPRQLAYFPAQIGSNIQRTVVAPVIRRSARAAVRPSALAAVIVVVSGLPLLHAVSPVGYAGLTLTAVAFGWLSPLQDHVRGSLHVVERHGRAAVCSVALMLTIGLSTATTLLVPLPGDVVALFPFGSLVLGNLVSTGIGVVLLRGAGRHDDYTVAAIAERSRYLFIELVIQGCWFACNYVVLGMLGAGALARLEAARISASPVLILATGVSTFMIAALLRQISASEPDGSRARRLLVRAFAIVLIGSALYAAVLLVAMPAISAALNRRIDPLLALVRIGAYALEGCSNLTGSVLLATGASRAALITSAAAGVVGLVGTALLAPSAGAVALPISQGTGMAGRLAVSVAIARERFR